MSEKLIIRGREIKPSDIEQIKAAVERFWDKGRKYISQELCKQWGWYQHNAALKEMACRELLLRLERLGYITLPPRKREIDNSKPKTTRLPKNFTLPVLRGGLKDFGQLALKMVRTRKEQLLLNGLLGAYHYLGYCHPVGGAVNYLAFLQDQPIACLSWGSAAWSVKERDQFIGWSKSAREKNLHSVVNNLRYLILPSVHIEHLASKLLAINIRRLSEDWQERYGHPLYLLETFVEEGRFRGTTYKAANWIEVGKTKGYSKRGRSSFLHGQIKRIFLYPLHKDFRGFLCHE